MNTIRLGFNGQKVSLAELQAEVGPGWAKLIEKLVADLFALGWDGKILQCKEKFGGLRFYTNSIPEEMKEVIFAAENESYKICEECGTPGVPRKGGWIKTLCDLHAAGREPHPDL